MYSKSTNQPIDGHFRCPTTAYIFIIQVNQKLPYNPVKLYLYSFVIDPLPALGLGQQEGYIQFEVRQEGILSVLGRATSDTFSFRLGNKG